MWIILYLIFGISQLGRHFWPEWSFVYGVKVDYLSPTLLITDLVWIGAVIWGRKNREDIFLIPKLKDWFKILNKNGLHTMRFVQKLTLIGLVIINILMASRWQIAIYRIFRWWQIWWWVKYVAENKKEVLRWLPKIIVWWVGIEAVLGLGQVVNGGSVEGIFYWLGERRFDYMTPGVAKISWFGDNLVRAYGTFSHPNSLAGFLLVAIMMLDKVCKEGRMQSVYRQARLARIKLWKWSIKWLAIVTIILTGSRLVWLVGVMLVIIKFKAKIGAKMLLIGILLMVGSLLFENRLDWLGGWSSQSVSMRLDLNKTAIEMIAKSPIFGVGVGNFLVELPEIMKGFWIIQPVHNIVLLGLSEMGIVGMVMVGLFLLRKIYFRKFGWVWLVIFLTGMLDHYWLTLPQNMFLLSLVAGLSLI